MSASYLTRPDIDYRDSYLEALSEYHAAGQFLYLKPGIETFQSFLEKRQSENGADHAPLPDWAEPVKETILWLVKDQTYIGECAIRHRVNWHLEKWGGHYDYTIRPSMRGKGFGKKLLMKSIPVMNNIGIERALITADPDNAVSCHIIESCGGEFFEDTHGTEQFPARKKYWLRTD